MLRFVQALSWATAAAFVVAALGLGCGVAMSGESAELDGLAGIAAVLGAIIGAFVGFEVASKTWPSRRAHIVALVGGGFVVLAGVVGCIIYFVLSERKQGTGMLAGLDEFLHAVLWLAIAAVGVLVCLAGSCGLFGLRDQSAPQARASDSQRA